MSLEFLSEKDIKMVSSLKKSLRESKKIVVCSDDSYQTTAGFFDKSECLETQTSAKTCGISFKSLIRKNDNRYQALSSTIDSASDKKIFAYVDSDETFPEHFHLTAAKRSSSLGRDVRLLILSMNGVWKLIIPASTILDLSKFGFITSEEENKNYAHKISSVSLTFTRYH